MGYTGVHYAVKDAYSLSGVILAVAFFTVVAVVFIPVTIIVVLVWLVVRLVQRRRARQCERSTAEPALSLGAGGPTAGSSHSVADSSPNRIRGIDRGPGYVDLFYFECSCGDVLTGTTPGQARTELREHLHDEIDWTTINPV